MTVTHAVAVVYLLMLAPASVQAQSTPASQHTLMETINVIERPNNHTLIEPNPIVLADAATGTVFITLPAEPKEGELFDLLKIDKTRNPCVVKANGKPVEKGVKLIIIKSDAPLQLRFQDGKWVKR